MTTGKLIKSPVQFDERIVLTVLPPYFSCTYHLGMFLRIPHLNTIHFDFAAQEAEKCNCTGLTNLLWPFGSKEK